MGAAFSIVIAGVVLAVKTEIVWIGAASGVIGLCAIFFVASIRNVRYVPKFGKKYNLLRPLICGFLVYDGVAWRGLLEFYIRMSMRDGWDIVASPRFREREAQNAVSVLKEFVQSVHPSSTRAGLDLKVTDIWSERILVQRRADGSQTRTSILEADSAQLYTINFRMNSQDGFALVSGREELLKLYAYVERGNLDDTLCIEGLRETLQEVRNLFAYDGQYWC